MPTSRLTPQLSARQSSARQSSADRSPACQVSTSRWSACLPLASARRALGALALLLCGGSGLAAAAEAGHVVLVQGAAQVSGHAVALGDAVAEGDEIATDADGYVYLRTIDNGLLILRPSSRVRIVAYHVDAANPANTRVKFALLAGVARSVSGQAVKLSRQNFRFNTPVAAIGVRGTDFTVYTDQETSRVTVLSGGIVVSGFSGACAPEGGGPCEHSASRELSAAQAGQMLQVHRGQVVPQLLAASAAMSPDSIAPPRGDEPVGKAGAVAPAPTAELSLDAKKSDGILQSGAAIAARVPVSIPAPVTPPPVVVTPPVPVVVPAPPAVESQIVWGRWQTVLDQAGNIDLSKLTADKAERIALSSNFALYRTKGDAWAPPEQGTMGFALKQSEALVRNESTGQTSFARLENGQLRVDFGKASFSTSIELLSDSERFKLQALGVLTRDGQLVGNNQFLAPTNMNVNGLLGPENGTSAAYIFSTRLDDKRIASGVTYWGKQ